MNKTDTIETMVLLRVMRHFYGDVATTKAVAVVYDNGITQLPVDFHAIEKIFCDCDKITVAKIFGELYHLNELNKIKAC